MVTLGVAVPPIPEYSNSTRNPIFDGVLVLWVREVSNGKLCAIHSPSGLNLTMSIESTKYKVTSSVEAHVE
jgi:hypothetical protein